MKKGLGHHCACSSKRTVRLINGIALDECLDPERYRTRVPFVIQSYLPVDNNSRSLIVACARSRLAAAIPRTQSSHSGPSGLGSSPFNLRNTMQAPSAARLLPSMKG